jgi:hypothetical protein
LIFKKNRDGEMRSQPVYQISGDKSIAVSVPLGETTATTYKPVKSGITKQWTSALAKDLGMSGDVRETRDAFYTSDADAQNYYFEVRKDTSMISFQKFNARSGMPQLKTQSVASVDAFLRKNNLLPPGIPEPQVVNNFGESISKTGERQVVWKTNVISYPQIIDGLPVFNAQFVVEVDSENNIIGLFRNWREYIPDETISLKSPDEAFDEFKISQIRGNGREKDKISKVTDMSLGYIMNNKEQVLVPMYLIEGVGQLSNSPESVSIEAKKKKIMNEVSPTQTPDIKNTNDTPMKVSTTAIETKISLNETISIDSSKKDQISNQNNEYINDSGNAVNLSVIIPLQNSTNVVNFSVKNDTISGINIANDTEVENDD